jgi:hypothetical protein
MIRRFAHHSEKNYKQQSKAATITPEKNIRFSLDEFTEQGNSCA